VTFDLARGAIRFCALHEADAASGALLDRLFANTLVMVEGASGARAT
jgi:hypothetical protein